MNSPNDDQPQPNRDRPQNQKGERFPQPHNSTFRFRAECGIDVQRLLKLIPKEELLNYRSIQNSAFPDVFIEIEVRTLSLDELRGLCRRVIDGHVMLQTLRPAADYTGERDWNLK